MGQSKQRRDGAMGRWGRAACCLARSSKGGQQRPRGATLWGSTRATWGYPCARSTRVAQGQPRNKHNKQCAVHASTQKHKGGPTRCPWEHPEAQGGPHALSMRARTPLRCWHCTTARPCSDFKLATLRLVPAATSRLLRSGSSLQRLNACYAQARPCSRLPATASRCCHSAEPQPSISPPVTDP
jgi:hypothetical protein